MRRLPTERIPAMPQITYHNAVRVFGSEDGADWLDDLKCCVQDPVVAYDRVIRLAEKLDCDGLRLFVEPERRRVERVGGQLMVLDWETGDRIGRIDALGGGGYVPDAQVEPVHTLAEAKRRLDQMVQSVSEEKVELLRAARRLVPDRFVASAPGGITMNTYAELRGPMQALMDLHDRPGFASAVMDLQAEARIEIAEKLVSTGIDALYIGDASASPSLISPEHFERFCLPAYRKFCQHFSEDILVYIHICGNANPILEMLADTGVHAVEPLDPAGGVEVPDAKRRIGSRVALMGGVSTSTLAYGTPEEVREEAVRKCREGGPHGYVLAAGCMVPPDSPLKNLEAMVEVAVRSLWRDERQENAA